MKKRFFKSIFIFICIFFLCISVIGYSNWDEANLLTAEEKQTIDRSLERLEARYGMDFLIKTVSSCDGMDAEEYAFQYDGTYNGALLLISLEYGDVVLATYGIGDHIFDSNVSETIISHISPYLREREFLEAFEVYTETVEEVCKAFEDGTNWDASGDINEDYSLMVILGGWGVALVIAFIVVSSMKSKLKSVQFQSNAKNYITQGSFRIVNSKEQFLYRNVIKTVRQTSNHASSGHRARSRGGARGKF